MTILLIKSLLDINHVLLLSSCLLQSYTLQSAWLTWTFSSTHHSKIDIYPERLVSVLLSILRFWEVSYETLLPPTTYVRDGVSFALLLPLKTTLSYSEQSADPTAFSLKLWTILTQLALIKLHTTMQLGSMLKTWAGQKMHFLIYKPFVSSSFISLTVHLPLQRCTHACKSWDWVNVTGSSRNWTCLTQETSCFSGCSRLDKWPWGARRRNDSRGRGEAGTCEWVKENERKRKKERTKDKLRRIEDRQAEQEKKPHWFSVSMCRLRRTKRLQHLICDILLWKLSLSLSLSVWRSSLATAVHKVWSMAELCHRIVNLADSAVCPMTNNKHAWPPITMRDVRAQQPIRKQT